MNVGVSVPLPAYLVDVGAMARTAEQVGFESFWCAVDGQPADRDLIRRLLDAGATRVIVRPATVDTDGEMAAQLARIAEAVLR